MICSWYLEDMPPRQDPLCWAKVEFFIFQFGAMTKMEGRDPNYVPTNEMVFDPAGLSRTIFFFSLLAIVVLGVCPRFSAGGHDGLSWLAL
jgi:hypothetical protein